MNISNRMIEHYEEHVLHTIPIIELVYLIPKIQINEIILNFNRKQNVTANVPALSSLNKAEQMVFYLIENNPKITRVEISIKINKAIKTVPRITDKLVEKDFLIRIGNN